MDALQERIAELVAEACGLVGAVARGRTDGRATGRLEHLRAVLVALVVEADAGMLADDACGVIAEIDEALDALDGELRVRGAA